MAKTSNTPGKTKGINFYCVQQKLYFVDLPGYGYSKTSQQMRQEWDLLIGRYLDSRSSNDVVLVVVDCRLPLTPLDLQMRDWLLAHRRRFAIVMSKADKLGKAALLKMIASTEKETIGVPVFACSCQSGAGRSELWRFLMEQSGLERFLSF